MREEDAAAARLHKRGLEFLDEVGPQTCSVAPGTFDHALVGTFARGTKLFDALVRLCQAGFSEAAEILNRALFEYAVVAWWMQLCDREEEDLIGTLSRHREHGEIVYHRQLGELPTDDGPLRPNPIPASTVRALDDEFGRLGEQWYGKGLLKLTEDVERAVEERYRFVFWTFFRHIIHFNSHELHHSALGIADADWDSPDYPPSAAARARQTWCGEALWASCWSYGLLGVATARRVLPSYADEWSSLLDEVNEALVLAARTQSQEPCPCGCGRALAADREPWVGARARAANGARR